MFLDVSASRLSEKVSPWQDYPQAYNVGTVGSQRCGPTSTDEDGIPADGSLGRLHGLNMAQ